MLSDSPAISLLVGFCSSILWWVFTLVYWSSHFCWVRLTHSPPHHWLLQWLTSGEFRLTHPPSHHWQCSQWLTPGEFHTDLHNHITCGDCSLQVTHWQAHFWWMMTVTHRNHLTSAECSHCLIHLPPSALRSVLTPWTSSSNCHRWEQPGPATAQWHWPGRLP